MKRFLSVFFSFFIALFFSLSVFAENTSSENRKFKISVKNAPEGSVRVFEVTRNEELLGNIKSTTVELMFENQTDRILEGDFEFALEEGENVVGYSLDINGKMRKGVVVEKEKARTVFESEVRKGVDPGFVEKTVGNNFKTRVYPIPAHGFRKIEIVFEKEIPDAGNNQKIYTQTIGTDTYFYFYEKAEPKKAKAHSEKSLKSLSVFFDVSDSAKNRDLKKEIDFLKAYSKSRNVQNLEITTFANSTLQSVNVKNDESGFFVIEALLAKQKFDGATNLNIDFSRFSKESSEIIVFSDGISNWGFPVNTKKVNAKRIITVNTSNSANFIVLKKLAYENGGTFINLREKTIDEAIGKLTSNIGKIEKIEFNGEEITDVYPPIGTEIENGFSVAGILKKKSGTIKITAGGTVFEKEISAIVPHPENIVSSDKVSRLWAMKKIEFLSDDKEGNRSEIIATAKKFTVVTDETSLIVLDTVYQYLQHDIVPPEELRAEYEKLAVRRNKTSVFTDYINGVPRLVNQKFDEFKNWWNKTPSEFAKEAKRIKNMKSLRSNSIRFEAATTDEEFEAPVYDGMATAAARASAEVDSFAFDDEREVVEISESHAEWNGTGFNPEGAAGIEGKNPPVYTDIANTAEPRMMAKSASRMASEPAMMNDAQAGASQNGQQIALKAWTSNAPYLSALKTTATEQMYEKYIELKKEYGTSPAFYIEVSDYFLEEKLLDESMRILSNLAELNLEDSDVLRALGNKLVERNSYELAIPVFERLTKIRAEIPQFYRDLALSYNAIGENVKAVENLWKIVLGNWDARFNEIQQIAINDINSIIARSNESVNYEKLGKLGINTKFVQNFDMDVRVILTWNTDDCDIDLWVTDPDGEKCYYGHKATLIGGRMSRDFTQGYGPEEFCLRNAKKGSYKIEANYYGTHQQKLLQPVIVQAEVYTNFGRPNQQKQVLTLQLSNIKGTFEIGSCDWE